LGDVLAAEPASDRRRARAAGVVRAWAQVKAHRWPDVYPAEAAIVDLRIICADGLPNRQVDIVWRHPQLPAADPPLQQARVDVDQDGATKAAEDAFVDRIVEVQEALSAAKRRLAPRRGRAREPHLTVRSRRI